MYGDGVKASAATGVLHWLSPPNGLWCTIDVMELEPKFLVGVVLDDSGIVEVWWYHREDREFKEIGSNDCV
jgi:hypothetical protein